MIMALKKVDTPKERMHRAHTLIKQKNYSEARSLLKGIDHPTAQKWRDKLDDILSEHGDPFADDLDEDNNQKHHPEVARAIDPKIAQATPGIDMDDYLRKEAAVRKQRSRRGSAQRTSFLIFAVIVIGIAAILLALVYANSQKETLKEGSREQLVEYLHDVCEMYADQTAPCISEADAAVEEHAVELWRCFEALDFERRFDWESVTLYSLCANEFMNPE
jgi:hypothetical protein